MSDTLFSKIIRREIPADIVYEDDQVLAFRDVHPQAPVHVLFVPKRAVASPDDLGPGDRDLAGDLILAAAAYARREGFAQAGYRIVMNCNADGGQTVFHLHLHLLAARPLTWPPGLRGERMMREPATASEAKPSANALALCPNGSARIP